MIAALVGCGGSSGTDGPLAPDGDIDFGDSNGDNIPDRDLDGDGRVDDVNGDAIRDVDLNGDGILDIDTNGDGIIDVDFDGDNVVDDVNADGFEDFDLNGDGILDVDLNENGVADVDEGGSGELSCPGGGEDPDSSNDQWNDNCVLQRDLTGERAYTSYYTRGVQRILFCLEFDQGVTDIGQFADAQYGPTTEGAVTEYQNARGLTADGVVGPETWQALFGELMLLPETQDNIANSDDSYAVGNAIDVAGCGDRVQFYRRYDANNDFDGWEIANNPGEAQRVEFSIRDPFQ